MSDRHLPPDADAAALRAEVERLHKIIDALMDRAELNTAQESDFNLFQSEVLLREQVRLRTMALEAALKENERMTHELRESEECFHRLFEQSTVGIVMTDGECFIHVNPKFSEITGFSLEELAEMGPSQITPPDERDRHADFMKKRLAGDMGHVNFTRNILRKDGEMIVVEITGGPPINVDGKPVLISVVSDVTEKIQAEREIRQLNEQLREQSIRDPLTGLHNRRYLEESIERELSRAKRHGHAVNFVISDLDFFKNINDAYGHRAGDRALCLFADLLRHHARESDIVSRFGGEEFMLVLPEMSFRNACARAEVIRRDLEAALIEYKGQRIKMTASFGVASYPAHGQSSDELFTAADGALYRAKQEGRNCVEWCDETRGARRVASP